MFFFSLFRFRWVFFSPTLSSFGSECFYGYTHSSYHVFILFITHTYKRQTKSLSRLTGKRCMLTIRPVLSSEAPFRVTISLNNMQPQNVYILRVETLQLYAAFYLSVFFLFSSLKHTHYMRLKADNWLEKATVHLRITKAVFMLHSVSPSISGASHTSNALTEHAHCTLHMHYVQRKHTTKPNKTKQNDHTKLCNYDCVITL